jgi:prepilin-type N-terminal cleavage/methylation domain-containing protein
MKNFIKNPRLSNSKGFTLIELMIVVVIIGILCAMAIPRWWKANERAKQSEAKLILKQIFTNEETYFQSETQYWIAGEVASSGNPDAFGPIWVEIMDGAIYSYAIAGNANAFTATATTNLDDDDTIDTWTMNQDGTLTMVIDDTAD